MPPFLSLVVLRPPTRPRVPPTIAQVKGALTQAFLRVEREYLYQVKAAFELGFGAVARTGACAIMALVRDNRLFVANAGDCRAVLGRRRPSRRVGGWSAGGSGDPEAVALSNDHNAKEQAEQAKLKKLHPFEGDVFTCKRPASCYVKGRLQVCMGRVCCCCYCRRFCSHVCCIYIQRVPTRVAKRAGATRR